MQAFCLVRWIPTAASAVSVTVCSLFETLKYHIQGQHGLKHQWEIRNSFKLCNSCAHASVSVTKIRYKSTWLSLVTMARRQKPAVCVWRYQRKLYAKRGCCGGQTSPHTGPHAFKSTQALLFIRIKKWFSGGEHALSVFASLWCLSVPKTCGREGVIKRFLEQAFCSRIRHSFITDRTETQGFLGPRFKTSTLRPNCAIQERRGKKVLINNEKMISMHQYEAGQDRRYEASGHQITLSHHRAAQTRPRFNLTLMRKTLVSVVAGDARKAQNKNGRAAAVCGETTCHSPAPRRRF